MGMELRVAAVEARELAVCRISPLRLGIYETLVCGGEGHQGCYCAPSEAIALLHPRASWNSDRSQSRAENQRTKRAHLVQKRDRRARRARWDRNAGDDATCIAA